MDKMSLKDYIEEVKWLCERRCSDYRGERELTMDGLRWAVREYKIMQARADEGLLATSSYESEEEMWLRHVQRVISYSEWVEKETDKYEEEEVKEFTACAQKLKDILAELDKEE